MSLVTVTLAKDWGPRLAGETFDVDPQRAEALLAGGYLATEKAPEKAPKDKMVRSARTKGR